MGFDFSFDVLVYDTAERTAPYDLSTILAMVATLTNDPVSPTVTLTKAIGTGVTIVDAPNGRARVDIDASDTLSLGAYGGIMYYEVVLTDAGSNDFLVAAGSLVLTP